MGRFLSGVDPLVADTLLALVLAVPLLVDLADVGVHPSPFRETDALGYALVALLVVPLALRRRFPVAVFCVILGAAIVTTLFAYRPASYGFGLIVATYTVARWCDRRTSLIALAAALGFSVFVKVRFILAGVDIGLFDWPLDAAYFAGSWFLGDSIRTRTRQAAELQRNREALAEQAVEREHLRIARELHDSIGHSLTIMVLYAGAAERVCETDPGRIRDLLETVATSGREAMAEMDRLVRVLRDESPSPADVSDVKALADEFRALGLPVEVTISGDAFALPSPVGHSAYRIAQEALTNTLKHAQANSARVQLQFASDALMVSVVDDGSGCPDVDLRTNGRHGLAGMRERVATLGGDLRVESGPAGAGFAVHARLPVTKERPQ
jgi:signal transduction histidine kinase